MIIYMMLEVNLHGLGLRSENDVETLRAEIETNIRRIVEPHRNLQRPNLSSDVEVEIIEYAGVPSG